MKHTVAAVSHPSYRHPARVLHIAMRPRASPSPSRPRSSHLATSYTLGSSLRQGLLVCTPLTYSRLTWCRCPPPVYALGRYDLSYIMHNPFLDRRIDVAHEAIGAGLRQLSIDLMVPKLPPTIVPPAKRNARVRRRKDDMQDGEDTTSVGRTPVKERLAGMSGGVEGGERREKRAGQQRVKRDLRV